MRRLAAAAVLVFVACGPKNSGPPGDPLRPQAKSLPAVVAVEERVPVSQPLAQAPDDCEPMAPNQGPPHKTYKERNIDEGAANAAAGLKTLIESESRSLPYEEVATKIEQAVQKFFAALAADPYNARATYNLAAAYARIGRNQCALNLLARLAAMKSFPSQKAAVEDHKNRLFGTGKKWNGKPDPDFDRLRTEAKFKEVTQNL
jgi:tetratricopeptide (TPR) repeat protein